MQQKAKTKLICCNISSCKNYIWINLSDLISVSGDCDVPAMLLFICS